LEHKLTFKEYSEALKQDKLLGLKCKQCKAVTVPPKIVCGECGSADLDVVQLSGKGEIQTYTVVFVPPEGRESEAPYIITLVKLEEGPWIMGNLAGVQPDKAAMDLIGKKVEMGHKVFPGDRYSSGEEAGIVFSLA